jgi:hypothetical protein
LSCSEDEQRRERLVLASPELASGKHLQQSSHLNESPAFQRPQPAGTAPVSDENMTRKYEELKKSYDALTLEKAKL